MNGVKAGVLRSFGVALVTLTVLGSVYLIQQSAWCPFDRAATTIDGSQMILESGSGTARRGDAIFACESSHCPTPFGCHNDFTCQCAPASLSAEAVGRMIGGTCLEDKPAPGLTDASGACRYARCDDHLDNQIP